MKDEVKNKYLLEVLNNLLDAGEEQIRFIRDGENKVEIWNGEGKYYGRSLLDKSITKESVEIVSEKYPD